jgi:hypothetical protein
MRKYFQSIQIFYYGLTTVGCAAIALVPGLSRISTRLLPWFEAFDRWLIRTLPVTRHFCWLAVARLQMPRHELP